MANFIYFVFGVVPDWVVWLGAVTGLALGAVVGVLGVVIEWRCYRRVNPRGSLRWHEGWVQLLNALAGCVFALVAWLAILGAVWLLMALTMYAFWSPALWAVIGSIVAVGVLVDRWVNRPVG